MADNLGVQPYSNADAAIDADFGQGQVASIQRLGAQVREDMKNIFTTRQVKQFIPALAQLRPDSPTFQQEAIGLAAQYPLAMTTPIGTTALGMLGQAHKEWVASTLADKKYKNQDALADQKFEGQKELAKTKFEQQKTLAGMRPANTRPIVAKPGDVVLSPEGKEIGRGLPKAPPAVKPSTASDTELRKLEASVSTHGITVDEIDTQDHTWRGDEKGAGSDTGQFAYVILKDGSKKRLPWEQYQKAKSKYDVFNKLRVEKQNQPVETEAPAQSLAAGGKVRVIDPQGRAGFIPQSQLDAALARGYKQP